MKQEELHVLACLGWTALWMAAGGLLLWLMDWLYRAAPALTVFLLFSLLALLAGRGLTQGGNR